jgi:hypothetical protein
MKKYFAIAVVSSLAWFVVPTGTSSVSAETYPPVVPAEEVPAETPAEEVPVPVETPVESVTPVPETPVPEVEVAVVVEYCSYNGSIANGCIVMQDGIPVGQTVEFFAVIDGDPVACWSMSDIVTHCVAGAVPAIVFTG